MKGYVTAIEKETRKNADFRRVLYTGKHSQLVLMSLKPLEEIGEEVHTDVDQFFRFETG
ncbi:MAG: cupin domain-containing protein, partial [Candidatus Thorarchaeota archaeon]